MEKKDPNEKNNIDWGAAAFGLILLILLFGEVVKLFAWIEKKINDKRNSKIENNPNDKNKLSK